jgi:uncharacterized protein YecT (DUF1311 family)
MKCEAAFLLVFAFLPNSHCQTVPKNIPRSQLQAVIDLPLNQAVHLRETYQGPLKAAYARQMALYDKDCQTEADRGQQQYNICIGQAGDNADKDFAIFYNNLQMLCHDQDQLATLQDSEKTWKIYRDSAMKAAHAAWPEGSGAPGFSGQVHLSLVRDFMRELHEIYGLNISQ